MIMATLSQWTRWGNSLTTGVFQGTVDFDPGAGVYNLTALSGGNVFISKLKAGIISRSLIQGLSH